MNKVEENYTSSELFTSKIHNFENLPEPRNATEEEQEAFHSKLYDFNIPNNINDFNKSNKQNNDEKEITQQQIKEQNINVDDEDEVYNNPNFHSKEQDELEIPDDGF
ncbi:unnamed protein product [Rhizophagus irregularis]|nr:unnamed protein product [Rhizophagus irregularis]